MKRKICISSVIILLFTMVISLYSYVTILLNAENRIIDIGDYYVLQTTERMYYQVCHENIMFDDETITRVNNFVSLENSKYIKACEISKDQTLIYKLLGWFLNGDIELEVFENNDETEICSLKECCQYYVKKDFSLPQISSNEIEAIVVVDPTDYNNVLEKYVDSSDIKDILENYYVFFQNIENTYSESYECFIVYRNYDLVEFISLDYFNSLQEYIIS